MKGKKLNCIYLKTLPNGVIVSISGKLPSQIRLRQVAAHVVARAKLERNLVIDACNIHIRLSTQDLELAIGMNARGLAQGNQSLDSLVEVRSPGERVIPENARNTRVGEDVGIASGNVAAGERPVLLGAAGVMIVHEGNGHSGPPTQKTRGLALCVLQTPVLGLLHGFLEDTLRGEVEGTATIIT